MTDDVDITQDLTGGADDAAFADSVSHAPAPAGTVPAHGTDTVHVNGQEAPQAPAAEQPKPAELNLRDTLSAAFKGEDGKPTDQAAATTAQPTAQPKADVPQLSQDANGKWRTVDGLFASDEQVAAFQAAQQQQPDPNAQQQQSPVLSGLTPAEQQQFQSLPAELRQFVERTMEDVNAKQQRYSEYDMLEQQLIGPRRDAWAAQGRNAFAAVNELFALSDFAGTRPGDFVLWFSQQHGLDLDALLDARDAAQANIDPNVQQLQGQISQLSATVQNFQQTEQQRAHAANVDTVRAFAEAKGPDGNLLRPYLSDVVNDFTAQISSVRLQNPQMPADQVLQKAYDNAVWTNPNVRARMQQDAEAQRRAQEQQNVQKARAAGASITGGPASTSGADPANSDLSIRGLLQQGFNAAAM